MNNPFSSLEKKSYLSGKKRGVIKVIHLHVFSEWENTNGEISSFNASYLSSNFLVQLLLGGNKLGKCSLTEDDYADSL